jgi:hypothetical protein
MAGLSPAIFAVGVSAAAGRFFRPPDATLPPIFVQCFLTIVMVKIQ